jgi:hypothetical protein
VRGLRALSGGASDGVGRIAGAFALRGASQGEGTARVAITKLSRALINEQGVSTLRVGERVGVHIELEDQAEI